MARSHARKRRPSGPASREEDLIARAEAAMAQLSTHFAGWMKDECRRLDRICRRAEADRSDAGAFNELIRAAHDIKGEAATFGFPTVERIAASLHRLASLAPDRAQIPFDLVRRHVSAAHEAARLHHEDEALAAELERASAAVLEKAGVTLYPEVKAPPLAPGA